MGEYFLYSGAKSHAAAIPLAAPPIPQAACGIVSFVLGGTMPAMLSRGHMPLATMDTKDILRICMSYIGKIRFIPKYRRHDRKSIMLAIF